MLRSWRSAYRVALCPDRLLAVRRRRGLRTAVDFKRAESFAPRPNQPAWGPAVEALDRFLAMPQVLAGELGMVLSNHFVRYLLVPWSEHIANAEEFRNYAAAAFEGVYGEMVNEWELCVSPEPAGLPRLAAAVDRALLDAVRNAAGRSRLRLTSIQPFLMAAYNRFERRREMDFVFIVVEARRACVLAAEGGKWRHVSAVTAPDDPAALAMRLEREIRLADLKGEAVPPVFVHAAQPPGLALPAVLGKAPFMLDWKFPAGLVPMTDAAFAMVATAG